MSTRNDQTRGPSRGLVDNIHRVFIALTGTLHTRLELVAVELEEEKSRIFGLLIMAGLTLIFTAFGVISFLVFILLSVPPEHRLMILGSASAVFLVLALTFAIFIRQRITGSRMLPETRKQLSKDLSHLKGEGA
ncbi:phage holin family protein (plasmid) [Serratia sp. PAMC26656]|uniref:phage holin family protein n=1 Tax=Serratia sp. PAMC26656 TaxID=2775909 RepID=UPI0018F5D084|nr:phage holin family protein [Serratia sp. PAMC26656]MBJ7889496.1 phage holin family protein [Serratia sp. PAMC26656]